ncbi:MAG: choice-of-anchor B family protein [Gemmatimonadales bacterium]
MMRASLFAVTLLVTSAGAAVATTGDWPDNVLPGFGRAVAIAGDQAFVGEPLVAGKPGLVHTFRRAASGRWVAGADLMPASGTGSAFGTGLATDGRTLLVAEQGDSGRGGVHVFRAGADGKWVAAGKLGPASPEARSGFGVSLLVAGDWAFIGQPGPIASSTGAVHLFRRGSDGNWTAAGTLPAASLAKGDSFGASLAASGDVIAVGATGRNAGKGEILIFRRGTDGAWTQQAAVSGRTTPDNGRLGTTLAFSGDRLVAGAPTAASFNGFVVIFQRDAKSGNWVERTAVRPFEVSANGFGSSFATVGDELWIGAPRSDRTGRIYRMHRDKAGSWTGLTKLAVDSVEVSSQFGATMAADGNNVIVGMPGDGGGEGTVKFLARTPTGGWVARGTFFPPSNEFARVTGSEVRCADGVANKFECGNTGLLSFLPISEIGGKRGTHMNDNWGWTDPETGKEYAILGRTDGTSFVDVSNPSAPRYLGDLPKTEGSPSAAWRDMKVYKNHVFIVADNSGDHGMQVFDLTHLRTVRTPQTFTTDAHYTGIASAHNIVLNDESGFAYAVGASSGGEICGGGLHMIDVRDPRHPTFAGCFSDSKTGRSGTGYSHDAQCVTYKGPDEKYKGHEICMGSNETAISIADVTDKKNPVAISRVSYPNVAYAHQGWLTDDHRFYYLNDEGDETEAKGEAAKGTRTLVWDVSDLDDPVLVKEHVGTSRAIDHNLYVKGNRMYQANYTSGLRILDISDPRNPREVGFLDTHPGDDGSPSFNGAWSTYPYFKSGTIIVTSIGEGVFFVRDRSQAVP